MTDLPKLLAEARDALIDEAWHGEPGRREECALCHEEAEQAEDIAHTPDCLVTRLDAAARELAAAPDVVKNGDG